MHKILIFGDSISFGRKTNKACSWPALLTNYFDQIDSQDISVFNLSIPGNTSADISNRFSSECLARINKQDKLNEISIIIAIGLNDTKNLNEEKNHTVKVIKFKQNIIKIINLAKKYSQNIIFIGCTKVDEEKSIYNNIFFTNKNIETLDKIIKKTCSENNIQYLPVFKSLSKSSFSEDGLHLNDEGHKKIYSNIIANIKFDYFDSFSILKKELSLSSQDIITTKSNFIENNIFNNDLFMGQFNHNKTQAVVGAPCIRNDITNISLNTFYQIFLPMKIASIQKIPVIIFLGIEEEILLQPVMASEYQKLNKRLQLAIQKIAKDLDIQKVTIIDTSFKKNNVMIEKSASKLNIALTDNVSSNLYNLSIKPRLNYINSPLRLITNQRIITCNTTRVIRKLSQMNLDFLIIEDIEQYKCFKFANKFDGLESPNFLAFLPLPNIFGNKTMFRSEQNEKILLGQKDNYYFNLFKKIHPETLAVYAKLFSIVENKEESIYKNYSNFYKVIYKISKYF